MQAGGEAQTSNQRSLAQTGRGRIYIHLPPNAGFGV